MSGFKGVPDAESGDDLLGVYLIGTVVDNDDPKHMERVKVTVPKLFVGDAANLPWVAPLKAWRFRNKANTGEFGLVPEVGDQVIIFFQQGKVLFPMYCGYPHQADERPAEFITNYLKRYGWKDPEGNVMFFDTTAGANPKFRFQHTTGVTVTISNTGRVTITAGDQVHINNTPVVVNTAPVTVNNGIVTVNNANVVVNTGDVIADNISLKHHVHGGVSTGSGNTAQPH